MSPSFWQTLTPPFHLHRPFGYDFVNTSDAASIDSDSKLSQTSIRCTSDESSSGQRLLNSYEENGQHASNDRRPAVEGSKSESGDSGSSEGSHFPSKIPSALAHTDIPTTVVSHGQLHLSREVEAYVE